VRAAFRPDGLGAVINSSRGVIFPFHPDDPDWEAAIVRATQRAIGELTEVAASARR
jgi:orotidine-5'-phosphate decarboxylase